MKKHQYKWRGWLVYLITAMLLLSCLKKEPAPSDTRLDILVVDDKQKPVPGAECFISASKSGSFPGTLKEVINYGSFKADGGGRILFDKPMSSWYSVTVTPILPYHQSYNCPNKCLFWGGDQRSVTITLTR